jgi:peptide chain release factor 1
MKKLIFSARKNDFRIDTFSAGGKGGQHQNKTQSGVRITHIPTWLSAECREHREQPRNKAEAFRKLSKILIAHVLEQEKQEREINTKTIRTYHQPDNRVVDHRTGKRASWHDIVEKGRIDLLWGTPNENETESEGEDSEG